MLQTSFPLKHLIVQLWLDARHTLFFFFNTPKGPDTAKLQGSWIFLEGKGCQTVQLMGA